MPSFPDSIFLFVLALLLFGPKRLPVLARELGKWVGEFRRASNEFKMQMEEELRLTEQADRQKQISAMEAAAPVTPPIPEAEQPQLAASSSDAGTDSVPETTDSEAAAIEAVPDASPQAAHEAQASEVPAYEVPAYEVIDGVRTPLPIATSGELSIMPPSTGLPTPQESSGPRSNALTGLLDAIPSTPEDNAEAAPETTAHGN
jgi:sec-independent protein translocase protein TatB